MHAQPTARVRFTRKGLAIACITISPLSHGQGTESNADTIDEIVVTSRYTTNEQLDTATGLGLTLYETPQSVTVMTAQRIADQDLDSLTDVVNNAAGMSARAQDSTRHTYSARGFEINNYQIDGIPIYWQPGGNAGETQSDMSLYERVEVVRGATGLLTGAGNPSASINLVRKHAESRVLSGSVDFSAGRWNTYGATADVSTPLNDSGSVRGRFVGHVEEGESFRDLAEESTQVFYGTLDADLTDNTLLRVGASRQENEPEGSTWGGLPVWDIDGNRTEWDRSRTIGTDWTSWSSTVEHYYLDLIHEFGDWTAKLSVNNNLNSSDQLLLYFGYEEENEGIWLFPSPRNAATERDQTSLSFQLSGDYNLFGRRHDLTFGVVDHKDDSIASSRARSDVADIGDFYEWDGSYPQPTWGGNKVEVEQTTEQFGVYAATRLSISDPFKIILGGRLADWHQTGTYYGLDRDYGDDNVFIPYIGTLYELNNQHTLYASYTEIFQPQNYEDKNGKLLDPVRGGSTEVGLKSLFFNGTLQSTISVFNIMQDNLGQAHKDETIRGREGTQAYKAADGPESQGFEFEVVGELSPNWDLSLSYTSFDIEDASGNAVNTNNPSELFKVFTTYYFDGQLDGLTIAGGVNWEGRNYTDVDKPQTNTNKPDAREKVRVEQEAYALASLMVRYELTNQLSAQLNVQNLLDETYYSQIGFYRQLEYGEPRSFTASLKYQF
ncbi:TonB-dependent siderophore receptor [Marinimicrobium locisalis]|uniref:TonB-dependent siderophore receptor n=1 Tax=Marinimicrobium locisalis TaxID=546022 RepID=UPI003221794A